MMIQKSYPWLLLALFTGVSILGGFAALGLREANLGARAAARNLQRSKELAHQIQALEQMPVAAESDESTSGELIRRVEQAAYTAQITVDDLLHIDPQFARRVGDTAYMTQEIDVALRNVALDQLIQFLGEVAAPAHQLQVTALRLTAPRDAGAASDDSERWHAEVTLTYLVFSPQSRRADF